MEVYDAIHPAFKESQILYAMEKEESLTMRERWLVSTFTRDKLKQMDSLLAHSIELNEEASSRLDSIRLFGEMPEFKQAAISEMDFHKRFLNGFVARSIALIKKGFTPSVRKELISLRNDAKSETYKSDSDFIEATKAFEKRFEFNEELLQFIDRKYSDMFGPQ